MWSVDGAAEIQRRGLLRVVLGLFATLRILGVGAEASLLTRGLRRSLWVSLRPVESAVRRLIVVASREMVVPDYVAPEAKAAAVKKKRGAPSGKAEKTATARRGRIPAFLLIDPRKDFEPRKKHPRNVGVFFLDEWRPSPKKPVRTDDDIVDGARLMRRLRAVRAALEDIQAQAHRLIAYQAALPPKKRLPPMRPGWPPGHRARNQTEVHKALLDCHGLAQMALNDVWKARQAAGP